MGTYVKHNKKQEYVKSPEPDFRASTNYGRASTTSADNSYIADSHEHGMESSQLGAMADQDLCTAQRA